jgi:hypothetical protein
MSEQLTKVQIEFNLVELKVMDGLAAYLVGQIRQQQRGRGGLEKELKIAEGVVQKIEEATKALVTKDLSE